MNLRIISIFISLFLVKSVLSQPVVSDADLLSSEILETCNECSPFRNEKENLSCSICRKFVYGECINDYYGVSYNICSDLVIGFINAEDWLVPFELLPDGRLAFRPEDVVKLYWQDKNRLIEYLVTYEGDITEVDTRFK